MFTGIIEEVGRIRELRLSGKAGDIQVEARKVLKGLQPGDSISVNGVCLTVRSLTGEGFLADISRETLARTSFARSKKGDSVNLERPLLPTSRLGGHFVQGHVDAIGRVEKIQPEGEFAIHRFSLPDVILPYVVEKGSIAVDGVSLTVSKVGPSQFEVALIPYTLENTNLGMRQVGDWVNLECDILAKYVESLLKAREKSKTAPVTLEYLREQGY
ncbi:MAG TPA: riboflavin synthase [Terriglobia bacterium]|nr:riboflavin synthase [Terriglobia bacterium]